MQYHMIYPVDRWVTAQQLLDAAHDAVANHQLDDFFPVSVQDAIKILQDVGAVTITSECTGGA